MYTTSISQIAVALWALTTGAAANGRCNNPRVDGIGQFTVADGQALQGNLAQNNLNNSPGTHFLLKANHRQKFTHGSAKACVVNSFLFANTHVALGDVAFAVNFLLGECGSAGFVLPRHEKPRAKHGKLTTYFHSGKFTIEGDTELAIDVFLQPLKGKAC